MRRDVDAWREPGRPMMLDQNNWRGVVVIPVITTGGVTYFGAQYLGAPGGDTYTGNYFGV